MGLFDHKYLNSEHIKGFDKYKYSSIDNSPLAVYVSHPFWNWVVEFYPRWLAPNVLTFGGWSLVMSCFLVQCCLDYAIDRNSVGTTNPIPTWFWLMASIFTFSAHTMDGTDGKQARRIGASGPTGELFDHGLDSWSTVPFTITIFSIFGQGDYSVPNLRLLCVLISVQVVFIVTHWEKYNTGVLFLSWGYDASQYGLSLIYLWTFIVGYEWYKFHILPFATFAECLEIGFYVCCIGSLIMSFYNMIDAYKKGTHQQPTLYEAVRPIFSCVVLFAVSVYWGYASPGQVIDKDPRMYFFTMGTVFSNIACRLIISQMASTRAEFGNWLLFAYSAVAGLSMYVVPQYELCLLRVVTVIILLAHIHYGICVVRQLCAHFKINAFNVSYLQKQK